MWLITRYGFFAVAYDRGAYFVRSHSAEHLERLKERFSRDLGGAGVIDTPSAAYRFRIRVSRDLWPRLSMTLAREVRWPGLREVLNDTAPEMAATVCSVAEALRWQAPAPRVGICSTVSPAARTGQSGAV